MIIKDLPVIDFGGVSVIVGNARLNKPCQVYRVYIGDGLIYPSGNRSRPDPLATPYRVTVRYHRIDDQRIDVNNERVGSKYDTTRTVTFETAFPSFVGHQTEFDDYKAMFNPSNRPFVNVSDALVVYLASVSRGGLVGASNYYDLSLSWDKEVKKRPDKYKEFPYLGRVSEADTLFITDVATVIDETYQHGNDGTPTSTYIQETKDLYYFVPGIWSSNGFHTYNRNKIEQIVADDVVWEVSNGQRTIYGIPFIYSVAGKPIKYPDEYYCVFYSFSGDKGVFVEYNNKTLPLGDDEVIIQFPNNQIPSTNIVINGNGTYRSHIYAKRHVFKQPIPKENVTADSRILQRAHDNPEFVFWPFGDTNGIAKTEAHGRREATWHGPQLGYGYDGGLYNVWPKSWVGYSYPLIPLRCGNMRDYCPGVIFSTSLYGHTPFYEFFNGEIIGTQYGGYDEKIIETYEILENNNPAYSSYSEWLADVTTPGHDPKPPVSS